MARRTLHLGAISTASQGSALATSNVPSLVVSGPGDLPSLSELIVTGRSFLQTVCFRAGGSPVSLRLLGLYPVLGFSSLCQHTDNVVVLVETTTFSIVPLAFVGLSVSTSVAPTDRPGFGDDSYTVKFMSFHKVPWGDGASGVQYNSVQSGPSYSVDSHHVLYL